MRDPKRMDWFLSELKKEWEKVPDWRFGQLIFNLLSEIGDPFYLEEDEFLQKIKDYLKKYVKS